MATRPDSQINIYPLLHQRTNCEYSFWILLL